MSMGSTVYVYGGMCLLLILAMIFFNTKRGKKWLESLDE